MHTAEGPVTARILMPVRRQETKWKTHESAYEAISTHAGRANVCQRYILQMQRAARYFLGSRRL